MAFPISLSHPRTQLESKNVIKGGAGGEWGILETLSDKIWEVSMEIIIVGEQM